MKAATDELIYRKTEAGLREMRERLRNLPRKTFLLLLAVDGQRSRHQLCSTLSAFGDVAGKLQILEATGLIEARHAPPARRPPTTLVDARTVTGHGELALETAAANDADLAEAAQSLQARIERPPPARAHVDDLQIDSVLGPAIGALLVTPPLPMAQACDANSGPNVNDYSAREIDRQRLPRLQALMAEQLTRADDPASIDLRLAIEQAQDIAALRRLIPDYASAIASLLTHDQFQAHTSTLLALATDTADLLGR